VNILFVHERAGFFGGVEQNIADSVRGLRERSIRCHLAYGGQFPAQPEFLNLFDSAHDCGELNPAKSILPRVTLAEIVARTNAECVYLHKMYRLPESLSKVQVRTVQMVHDHDLCCPRKHKYFAHNGQVCSKPAGLRCYLDGAFLVRDPGKRTGVRFESIGVKLHEMKRRQALDAFLAASEFMQQELEMNGFPAEKIHVLPLAIRELADPTAYNYARVPTVLFVGQLIRGKGVDLLLMALARIKTPFQAVIAGKGNAEEPLRKLSESLGLKERVEFRGWVANDELPKLYGQAQVVAVPSRWPEPFGLVGLEAMRNGRAVVAFNSGGIPDWLGHERTGLLVPQGDVAEFACALERLLQDSDLATQMGIAGLQDVARRFGYEGYITGLQRVLLPGMGKGSESREMRAAGR